MTNRQLVKSVYPSAKCTSRVPPPWLRNNETHVIRFYAYPNAYGRVIGWGENQNAAWKHAAKRLQDKMLRLVSE